MKTYNLKTVSQFLDVVNDDNIEVLLLDFAKFLTIYNNSIKAIREGLPKETEGKTNLDLLQSMFIWTDDGISEITEVKIENSKTGEIKTIKKK